MPVYRDRRYSTAVKTGTYIARLSACETLVCGKEEEEEEEGEGTEIVSGESGMLINPPPRSSIVIFGLTV